MRIVLVEDNVSLAHGIENALKDQGHAVDWLSDGAEGAAFLTTESADLAIIDVNLPGLSGFEIVRHIRSAGHAVPVLMLTARSELVDRIEGLDAGADDYLVKPFEMAELCARIRALARRQPNLQKGNLQIGALRFDRTSRLLSGPNGPIDLPRRELALFECLVDHSGRIVSKDRIADTLYGVGSDVEANAVELLISRLRRKLAGAGVTIRTARGLGYLMDDAPE
ncbi:response regulator transcription factor [Pseudorhodobacter sp.]|uniref:response regulator transcription factor n=1 Tax=Pseudorhodobacter sp. TaxID=1934400 RepID=UPI002647F33A|nr:response regulator transcription factor [Pseudorhodobacter sp.]MDN5786480.1 response regulator transcription factor [Pseudorhodobacter sp.]